MFIENLVEVPIQDIKQAFQIINAGLEFRTLGSQMMNQTSSRSHTILNVEVYQDYDDQEMGRGVTGICGKLTLVDLAGSERIKHTKSNGLRLEEARFINTSLTALGAAVSAISENKPFVPFRSSKLTRVLESSLKGSAKVVMLATLGPSLSYGAESLSTLQFATRC